MLVRGVALFRILEPTFHMYTSVSIIMEETPINSGLRNIFIINGSIWMVSCWFTLVFQDWVPDGLALLPPMALASTTIIGIFVFLKMDRASKTDLVCSVDGCENKVRINKQVCPIHDDEVQNLVRNNRIAAVIGSIASLAIYLLFF